MIIAIDGPAGSGKSTVAKKLAQRLSFFHLNSGMLYRWVAYNVKDIDIHDIEWIVATAKGLSFDNIDKKKIYTDEISKLTPLVAKILEVRLIVLEKQREIKNGRDIIAEGRDVGSVVFPDAEIKIFLSASQQERAKRRLGEYKDKDITFDEVLDEIKQRDHHDSVRKHSPLVKADGATEIDTTDLSIDEVIEQIYKIYLTKI